VNALRRFERILESLKPENDYYCLNLDFDAYLLPPFAVPLATFNAREFRRYCKALAAVDAAYADSACWAKKSILNVARRCVLPHPRLLSLPSPDSYFSLFVRSGHFSSDHTIRQCVHACYCAASRWLLTCVRRYAEKVWNIRPCKLDAIAASDA
jgi:hypothetical protein